MEARLSDDYLLMAQQMFEGCGMDSNGALPVNTLLDKFAAYVPTDKGEYSELRVMLDPARSNPSIGVGELAGALERYSDRQHSRGDFDDSISLRNGHTALDSDSGISADLGYHLLEELQSELRDKGQAVRKMKAQLEATERQHEESLASVVAERDSLRAHLQLMREENSALASVRRECEESGERLQAAEAALERRGLELDSARRRVAGLQRAQDKLESEKSTLQELLAKSKEECHRMNDMYAARQAALIEENETFRADYADLSTRYREREESLQQTLREKSLLEMEVSDVLNRSRPAPAALDTSVEVSYTDAQLLSALDTLNSETDREENLSQEIFCMSGSKCERGRPSLFDELLNIESFRRTSHVTGDVSAEQTHEDATTQTDEHVNLVSDNSIPGYEHCPETKNSECSGCVVKNARLKELEANSKRSDETIRDLQVDLTRYEHNITILQSNFDSGEEKNRRNQSVIELLRRNLEALEAAFREEMETMGKKTMEMCCIETQTPCDMTASVATQASEPCAECAERVDARSATVATSAADRVCNYLWGSFKWVLQLLAVLFLCAALLVLYNVSHYSYASRRCVRPSRAVPWQWLSLEDVLGLLLRVEYVGEVPV